MSHKRNSPSQEWPPNKEGMKLSSSAQTSRRDRQKKLGAFYTPPELAQIIVEWAIRDPKDTVLEPSFGGCCFVNASWDRLRRLGTKSPFKKLHGADIDRTAFIHLRKHFSTQRFERRFVKGDYLLLQDNTFLTRKFDVIIGNPPYISYSALTPKQRSQYQYELRRHGVGLKGRPSLWAYFVLASFARLKPLGRMAWVLPWAYLHSSYGVQLQSIIRKHFSTIAAFAIEESLFLSEGTKERSVVVLADGYSSGSIDTKDNVTFCANFKEFCRQFPGLFSDKPVPLTESIINVCVRKKAEKNLQQSTLARHLRPLGDFGTIDIGVVTGDMKTFMLTKVVAQSLGLGKHAVQTCLVRSQHVPGLVLSESDINRLDLKGLPTRLLTLPSDEPLPREVKTYLEARCPPHAIIENATFRKRRIWYTIPKQTPPDGIISYFSNRGPRLIINECQSAATNSMFCLWLNQRLDHDETYNILASISLSMLSGVGRSYSEIYGGRSGNSALKLGVGVLRNMPVFVAPVNCENETRVALAASDRALRDGNQAAAAQIANRWLRDVSGARYAVQNIEAAAAAMLRLRTGGSAC